METGKLKYLSEKVSDELFRNVEANLDRYLTDDFLELARAGDWSIELSLAIDLAPLKELVGDNRSEAEVKNSLLVWKTLSRLTPSLATENRIWTRLCHIECLHYARTRWLDKVGSGNGPDNVRKHFFARTLTGYRDDNAIGRLWWNAYIAKSVMPDDIEKALRAILKTADIRSNLVERPWITSRPKLAAGIIRTIIRKPAISEKEEAFRDFMKTLNRRGGGMLFELMNDRDMDSFMDMCG